MRKFHCLQVLLLAALLPALFPLTALGCPEFLDQDMRKLHSSDTVNLCEVAAEKPLLIVNTASHCGFTRQFTGLEELHQRYSEKGLVVVGFSSNDFRQAAKTEEEAATICYKNFGVNFLMLAPTHVKGAKANPVFVELAEQTTEPKWNFNKYLVDRSGKVTEHFGSATTPTSDVLQRAVEQLL